MQLSLRTIIFAFAALALVFALAAPYYTEYQKTYRVLDVAQTTGGWENANVSTGFASPAPVALHLLQTGPNQNK